MRPLSEEKISTTGVTQRNLEFPLPPNSLDSHQTQNNKMISWTEPPSLVPLRRIDPLDR